MHPDHAAFSSTAFGQVAHALDDFAAVFTTNYDLIPYWSHMEVRGEVGIVDMFRGAQPFDPDDPNYGAGNSTAVHYLHGAIHLWLDSAGDNGKWVSDGHILLGLQQRYRASSVRQPLFVSEGTSSAKLQAIRRSPYLAFCRQELRADEGNTVVFGHSLSEQDEHIVKALVEGRERRFAVSLRSSNDKARIRERKATILRQLDGHEVCFFDSSTHPLGDPSLRIKPLLWSPSRLREQGRRRSSHAD